jgi:predicted transcriptional regulator of viral defense system
VLREKREELSGVNREERTGLQVRVTSLEGTMVDLLDRPELGGGYEGIWRSLEAVEFFDLTSREKPVCVPWFSIPFRN